MVMSDTQWTQWHAERWMPIVHPFAPEQARRLTSNAHAISYGLSSAGYDLRLDPCKLAILKTPWMTATRQYTLDPKRIDQGEMYREQEPEIDPLTGEVYWEMAPGSYALGLSLEHITMPRDYLGLCIGKSTYARSGLVVNTTPLEPGWCGHLVIELFNALRDYSLRVYANEGIAQLVLLATQTPVTTSYADREGKYQDQQTIVASRV
jgi:dCTP deaminase